MRSAAAAAHEKMKTEWDVDAAISTYNVDGWGTRLFHGQQRRQCRGAPPSGKRRRDRYSRSRKRSARVAVSGSRSSSGFRICCGTASKRSTARFKTRSTEFGYKNQYRGVFPIKVNQLREVVEEIVDAGQEFHFGLEAGSKPELVAALAMHKDPESLIICNGYKDRAFIRIALLGRKLGKSVIIVVEKLEELEQTIRAFEGSRRRAAHRHPRALVQQRRGQMGAERRREREVWSRDHQPRGGERDAESGGTRRIASSSFISTSARRCRTFPRSNARCAKRRAITRSCASSGMSSATSMSAAGSASITTARAAISTARRIIRSRNTRNDVVWNIMDVCDPRSVAHPAIVSESGRAIVAHHSVLVVEAFGSIEKDRAETQGRGDRERSQAGARDSRREAAAQARQPPRESARHPADQGRSAADVRPRPARSRDRRRRSRPSTGSSPSRS